EVRIKISNSKKIRVRRVITYFFELQKIGNYPSDPDFFELGQIRWRDAFVRRLLETESDFQQLRLAALRSDESNSKRSRLRVEALRKWRASALVATAKTGAVRHKAEGNSNDRIASTRSDSGSVSTRCQDRIQVVCL